MFECRNGRAHTQYLQNVEAQKEKKNKTGPEKMSFLKINYDKSTVRVSLNKPEKRNALDLELMTELTEFFNSLKGDLKDFKVVVLEGEGKSFCAGADLSWMKEMADYSFEENIKDSETLFNLFHSIQTFPLPVVVNAHGHVYGGGLGLLAAADFVLAEKDTKFCFSEVKLGLAPAVISSFVLSKCDTSHAPSFMLSGMVFNNSKAFHMGLINDEFDKESFKNILKSFDQSSQEALMATKKLILTQKPIKPESFKELTLKTIAELRVGKEAQSRMKAFLNK